MKRVLIFFLTLYGIMALTACKNEKDNFISSEVSISGDNLEDVSENATVSEDASISDNSMELETIDEPVTLKWYMNGANVTNDTEVIEMANAYLKEKLNVTLEPVWGTWEDFDWGEGAEEALLDKKNIDIYFTASWTDNDYSQYAKEGYWVRLDTPGKNLLEAYGQDVWNELPEDLKSGAITSGADGVGVYGVPCYGEYATQFGWDVNVTLLEKYGYTLDDIKGKSYYELNDILTKIKAGEGDDFYPIYIENEYAYESIATGSICVYGDTQRESLVTYYVNPEDLSAGGAYGITLQNRCATDEYKAFVEQTREYHLEEMILHVWTKDVMGDRLAEGNYLIAPVNYELGYEEEKSRERGITVAFVPAINPFVDTRRAQGEMLAISKESEHPARAMMFLNLLNSDPYLMTLLTYGLEGIHYNYNQDGMIEFSKERDNYQPWRDAMGNIDLLPVRVDEDPDWKSALDIYNGRAKVLPILGFALDTSELSEQRDKLTRIAQNYTEAFGVGSIDPAEELPKLNNKLQEAGIEEYQAEAQRQLDEFLANK